MKVSRRELLITFVKGAALSALPMSAYKILSPSEVHAALNASNVRWGFIVNTEKCVGCGFCVKACKLENEVPYDLDVTRTWVERYVIMKDGRTMIDSPHGARDGFTNPSIRGSDVNPKNIAKAFFVPKLCNQCENPPCVQVCPVGATYSTADGVVLVDRTWCIGCGYCIMACPYGVRFFHPKYKVAEKCTFCYHRIRQDLLPACVEVCPTQARIFGELGTRSSPLHRMKRMNSIQVLKPELNTDPKVLYSSLDGEVR